MCKVPRSFIQKGFPANADGFSWAFFEKKTLPLDAVGGLPGVRVFLVTSDLFGLTINSLQFHVILCI